MANRQVAGILSVPAMLPWDVIAMNGIVLLVSMTAIGVDYGWQMGPDGQVEYIVQIEPALIDSLKSGSEIVSEIHPEVRNVRRLRIRVGTNVLPRGERQLASNPAASRSAGSNVAHVPGAGVASIAPPVSRSLPLLNLPPPPQDIRSDGMASVLIRDGTAQPTEKAAPQRGSLPAASSALIDLPPPPTESPTPSPSEPTPNGQWQPPWETNATPEKNQTPFAYEPTQQPAASRFGQPPSSPPATSAPPRPIVTPNQTQLDQVPAPIRDPDAAQADPANANPANTNQLPHAKLQTGRAGMSLNTSQQPVVEEPPTTPDFQQLALNQNPDVEAAAQKPEITNETYEQLTENRSPKPWMPLVLTSLALFASLAVNLYLGWIALGIYRKYRSLAVQLHQAQMA